MTYKRILVTGTLTCLSDLHVGDGDLALQSERKTSTSEPEKASADRAAANPNRAKIIRVIALDGVNNKEEQQEKKEKKKEEPEGSYNTVCRDYQNRAYIPGSTLRGSLASFLDQKKGFYRKFFGYADEETGNGQAACRAAGLLRVYDARLQEMPNTLEKELGFLDLPGFSQKRRTFLRHSVSICPVTGTAAKGKLFCYEFVPKDSVFTLQFQVESRNKVGAEELTEKELAQLLGLAQQWNAEAAAVGSGVTKGYGRVQWKLERVEALSVAEELHWLESNSLEPPPMKPLTDTAQSADISTLLSDAAQDTASLKFTLNILPKGPFLVNEPEYVQDKAKQKDDEHFSDLEYSRNHRNGKEAQAFIPSRTLAGAIRGRARRILATIAHQHYGLSEAASADIADPLVKKFFGSEERRGALRLTEAGGEAKEHIQNFIGVDRFTGGVNKGANYKVRAAACNKLSASNCLLDRRLTPNGDWWKGMLLLVLLDGMDGDMQIGWGKAKGYGKMNFQLEYGGKTFGERQKVLDEIRDVIGQDAAKQWVEALHDQIRSKAEGKVATGGLA
ncbi:MAG: RAMP superfamily CRISPR-associated protein [Candidatus Electrothrix communis]|nr:MAG: RAMP superfamily CRISPR-associated protein [Candidatus Electrothrix communis]